MVGTIEGWFTGKSLTDYIDDVEEADDEDLKEFIEARRTVNGTDKAKLIGGHAIEFEKALKAGGYVSAPPVPDIDHYPEQQPTNGATRPPPWLIAIFIIALIVVASAAFFFLPIISR